jgi:hypothetical protein
MTEVQYVTVQGCSGAKCPDCALSERLVRGAVQLAGLKLPAHKEESKGEFFLADGQSIEIVHLSCSQAEGRGLDPAGAPFLFVDGKLVISGSSSMPEAVAKALTDVLFPGGAGGASLKT